MNEREGQSGVHTTTSTYALRGHPPPCAITRTPHSHAHTHTYTHQATPTICIIKSSMRLIKISKGTVPRQRSSPQSTHLRRRGTLKEASPGSYCGTRSTVTTQYAGTSVHTHTHTRDVVARLQVERDCGRT